MKRILSILLAVLLLASCLLVATPKAYAAKPDTKRTIGVVFDNSGSMYQNIPSGEKNGPPLKAWCQATYAMEVFASMLNEGDTLRIYPMNPITVDGQSYDYNKPLEIKSASEAGKIRKIYSVGKLSDMNTHIESVETAAADLRGLSGGEKTLVVLTDGAQFCRNNQAYPGGVDQKEKSKQELDAIFKTANKDLKMMYLGIDPPDVKAIVPDTPESAYFVKRTAATSADVLSTLTELCNLIFGRDALFGDYVTNGGKTINFDVSMKKLIVFVQGTNIDNVALKGKNGASGKKLEPISVKYSEKGCDEEAAVDNSLQGMIVTYEDCAKGEYELTYTGTHTSVEYYYEPDVDLQFVFTDADGNKVDPNALYEGEYKVTYGMMDGKTGEISKSALLGKPQYKGTYVINGQEHSFDPNKSEEKISLKKDDKFSAEMTVTYLSGYTISKDSTDFGWPEGGIQVAPRPAGKLELEISGGQEKVSIKKLAEGTPYVIKAFFTPNGEAKRQLTGAELQEVFDKLSWNADAATAVLKKELANDQITIKLDHKNPAAAKDTASGECLVELKTAYTAPGSNPVNGSGKLKYNIDADLSELKVELSAESDYIVISEMVGKTFTAKLTLNGQPLTAEQFALLPEPVVEHGDIKVDIKADPANSCYKITLVENPGVKEGDYSIKVHASFTDEIGRETAGDDSIGYTLSSMPLWLKYVIFFGGLILLIILIWIITHIRVMPSYVGTDHEGCKLIIGGRPVVDGVEFSASLSGTSLECKAEYAGETVAVGLSGLEPGKQSFLYKSSGKRSILESHPGIAADYQGDVKRASFDGNSYKIDQNNDLMPEDPEAVAFTLTNDFTVAFSGNILVDGKEKTFNAEIPVTYRKQ